MAVTKRKRKKNPYQAEVWVSGVMVATQAFDTKAAAHTWHDKTKRAYLTGEAAQAERKESLTFSELLDDYERERVPRLAPALLAVIRPQLRLFRESPLAEKRVRAITAKDIFALLDFAKAHPTAQNKIRQSFDGELKRLSILFTHFREEYDDKFVSPLLKKHWADSRIRPKRSKLDKYIPLEVVPAFLAGLRASKNPVYYDVAVVMLVLGLRIGEAASLKWDAIDPHRRTLHVKRGMEWRDTEGRRAGRKIVEKTKTDASNRTLPIPALAIEAFERARARHPASEEVFRCPKGKILQDQNLVQVFNRVLKKIGVKWTGSHLCRHTAATLPLLAGLPLEQVQTNLGHTSRAQTETYAKVLSIVRNRVPETVAGLITGALENDSRTLSRTLGPAPEKPQEMSGS